MEAAISNHVSHAALPYPVKGARYTLQIPYLDADGDPLDPTTPDTEVSKDAGAYADATEEVTTITGANGSGFITLTGAETDASMVMLAAKVASGPKATLATLYPRVLPVLESGTAQAGAAGSITLAAGAAAYNLIGCILKTTGGTGGGGVGGANNQARVITAYNTGTKVATVTPNWETNPDATTTYDVLLTEMAANAIMGRFLRPTVDERTLDVTATGAAGVDWNNVENPTTVLSLSGTTVKTATDVETDTQDIQARLPAALTVDGNMKADTLRVGGTLQTAGDLKASLNTIDDFVDTEVAAIQTDVTTLLARLSALRAGYLDNLSAGAVALQASVDDLETRLTAARAALLDQLDPAVGGTVAAEVDILKEAVVVRRNTAQAGAAGTITLDAGASATDDFYNDAWVVLVGGTGAGQIRLASDYVGVTKVLSVAPNWTTAPDVTSVFIVLPAARVDLALWLGSAANALIAGRVDANAQIVGGKVTPIDVDGLTFASAMEAILAVLAGVATPSGTTVAFKRRDGVTTKISIVYGSTDGERTSSTIT